MPVTNSTIAGEGAQRHLHAFRISRMKILYHHRTASRDGQTVHIDEMIASLRAAGHELRVVAPDAAGDASMGGQVGWVHKLRAALPRAIYELLELGYSLLAYRRLARAAADFRPDFIYERYNLFLLSGLMVSRRLRVPLLLEVNAPLADERARFGGLGLPWLARWAEGLVWRGADVVLPVTRVLGEQVAARGVPRDRIEVIPNGINQAHFAAAPPPHMAKSALGCEGALVLGFTGFVRDWHGVDRVLRWMANTQALAEVRLLVVGDGPARPDLEQLAGRLGLSERVHFTGVVPRERVPEHVAAFDVALQPAVVPYASPLKLFEYLAMSKAIIAPDQPNIAEVLQDDFNAALFDAQRPGDFEETLTRLCGDRALRERLARNAGATIERLSLTWDANAARVCLRAQQVCDKRRGDVRVPA